VRRSGSLHRHGGPFLTFNAGYSPLIERISGRFVDIPLPQLELASDIGTVEIWLAKCWQSPARSGAWQPNFSDAETPCGLAEGRFA
jgi:hypothetical protein